jgi:Tol biopolymer transport system component/DNA-binding CsgD family transcriptional regulator
VSDTESKAAQAEVSFAEAPPRITPREREILGLIAEGLTDQEIAQRLYVGRSTVRTHQVHLRQKLGVRNRMELVRAAEGWGLLRTSVAKSKLVWIGEGQSGSYTGDQDVHPTLPSAFSLAEDAGSHVPAESLREGEDAMLNQGRTLLILAAVLAAAARNGSAAETAGAVPGQPSHTVGTPHDPPPAGGMSLRRIWTGPDVNPLGSVSFDGRYLSFHDRETSDLAVRDLATGANRRLTNNGSWLEAPGYPGDSVMSPDGRQVAYSWDDAELRILGLDGTPPRILYRNGELSYLQPYDWSQDGSQILALFQRKDGNNQIVLVSTAEGKVRVLKSLEWRYPHRMRFSPDGSSIAYDFQSSETTRERDINLLTTDAGQEFPLVKHPADDFVIGWAPDGRRFLFGSDRMGTVGTWLLPVAAGKPDGDPRLVRTDMGSIVPLGITRGGALYYMLRVGMQDAYTTTLDVGGGQPLASPAPISPRSVGGNAFPAWSPDGRTLAYLSEPGAFFGTGHHRLLCLRSSDLGAERRIRMPLSYAHAPRWSPDGRSLLFSGRDAKNRYGLYLVDVASGKARLLFHQPPTHSSPRWPTWSPDGKALFYAYKDMSRGVHRIVRRELVKDREQELAAGYPNCLAVSPDGRQLAFSVRDWETHEEVLKLVPTTGGASRELLRVASPANSPERIPAIAWTPDGRSLLFGRKKERDTRFWRISPDGGRPRRLELSVQDLADGPLWIHPDGRQIAFTAGRPQGEVWVMEHFLPPAPTPRAEAPQ